MCEKNINRLSLTSPQLGTWPKTEACALFGNYTGVLSIHKPVLNPLSYTSHGYLTFLTALQWEDF